ncbi:MAG: hypothetical protein ABF289_05615 [Clostridiales bacterium]
MNIHNAIRGMRNPMNSWNNSDSNFYYCNSEKRDKFRIGKKDKELAMRLIKTGTDHSKFLRQIFVSIDITAPLCWWKDFDTYKISTVSNSCSTMHKLGSRELTVEDFSWDELTTWRKSYLIHINELIGKWRNSKSEKNFREMIHDLLDSYNQKRTWSGNYQNLRNIYFGRKSHKQREFRDFCEEIKLLPYSEFITE